MSIIVTPDRKPSKAHRHTEEIVQSNAFMWLWNAHPETRGLYFSVLNETTPYRMTKEEQIVLGVMRKRRGVVAGVSDNILLMPNKRYHFCCAEGKTTERGSHQSEAQKAFQRNVERVGGYYFIYRTIDEFKAEMERYLSEM